MRIPRPSDPLHYAPREIELGVLLQLLVLAERQLVLVRDCSRRALLLAGRRRRRRASIIIILIFLMIFIFNEALEILRVVPVVHVDALSQVVDVNVLLQLLERYLNLVLQRRVQVIRDVEGDHTLISINLLYITLYEVEAHRHKIIELVSRRELVLLLEREGQVVLEIQVHEEVVDVLLVVRVLLVLHFFGLLLLFLYLVVQLRWKRILLFRLFLHCLLRVVLVALVFAAIQTEEEV